MTRWLAPLILVVASPVAHAAEPAKTITVAADGSGDFKSVQAAVDAAPAESPGRVVIRIKPGTYKEQIHIRRDKPRLTLKGDDARTTVLTFDLTPDKVPPSTTRRTAATASTLVEADDFAAENLTFENSAGDVGQAVALRTTGRRQAFRNCRMLGWQDTLYLDEGTQYFAGCYIEGRVDFIFGHSTAVFERCHIHSKNGGYVTAAATPQDKPFGYVFLDCKLTGHGEPAYLGRPWRDYGAVAFIRCELSAHVRPDGWHNWDKPEREKTSRFAEHKCTGPGADRSKRVAWSRELTDAEAANYAVEKVLGADSDKWAGPADGAKAADVVPRK